MTRSLRYCPCNSSAVPQTRYTALGCYVRTVNCFYAFSSYLTENTVCRSWYFYTIIWFFHFRSYLTKNTPVMCTCVRLHPQHCYFFVQFPPNSERTSNFAKIRPLGAEFFLCTDRQTDGQDEVNSRFVLRQVSPEFCSPDRSN